MEGPIETTTQLSCVGSFSRMHEFCNDLSEKWVSLQKVCKSVTIIESMWIQLCACLTKTAALKYVRAGLQLLLVVLQFWDISTSFGSLSECHLMSHEFRQMISSEAGQENDKLPELLTSFTSTLQLFISMCKVAGFSGTLAFLPKGTHPGFVPCTSRSRSRSSRKGFNKTLRWHPKENCQDGKPVQALLLEGRSFTHRHGSFTHWHGPFTHHGSFAHRHRTFAHRHRHRTFAHALASFWWKEARVCATFPCQICEDASEVVNLCFAASLYMWKSRNTRCRTPFLKCAKEHFIRPHWTTRGRIVTSWFPIHRSEPGFLETIVLIFGVAHK